MKKNETNKHSSMIFRIGRTRTWTSKGIPRCRFFRLKKRISINKFFDKLLYHSPVSTVVVFGPLIVFCILPQLYLEETCEEQRDSWLIIYLQSLSEELHDEIHSDLRVEEPVVVCSSVVQVVVCVAVVESHIEMSIVLQSERFVSIEFAFQKFIPGETDGCLWRGDN